MKSVFESILVGLNPSHIPIYGTSDPPLKSDAHLTDQVGQPMWNPPIQVVLTQALASKDSNPLSTIDLLKDYPLRTRNYRYAQCIDQRT